MRSIHTPNTTNEGFAKDIEFMNKDDFMSFIKSLISDRVLTGDIKPGEYLVIDDDCIMVGDEDDFDSDVLLYAIKINDIINFDNVCNGSDFVDLSKAEKLINF